MKGSALYALLFMLALAAALASPASAQGPVLEVGEGLYEFHLADGSRVVGHITGVDARSVRIETVAGARIEVDRHRIRSVRPAPGRLVNGAFWPEDPNLTRLLFGPTARTLERGEGYVGGYMLFVPLVAYGLTDALTIAGGTPVIPEVLGRIWYIAPKLRITSTPRIETAVGAYSTFSAEGDFPGNSGLLYGVGTFGSSDDSFTIGPAWLYELEENGGGSLASTAVLLLAGEHRVRPSIKLISENYLGVTGARQGALLSGGVRFFGERFSADVGAVLGLGMGDSLILPALNIVYNFGRSR